KSFFGVARKLSHHEWSAVRTVCTSRQFDCFGGVEASAERYRHAGLQWSRLVRCPLVAPDVEERLCLQFGVVNARQTILLRVQLARHAIDANLMRLEDRAHAII